MFSCKSKNIIDTFHVVVAAAVDVTVVIVISGSPHLSLKPKSKTLV